MDLNLKIVIISIFYENFIKKSKKTNKTDLVKEDAETYDKINLEFV